MEQDYKQEIEKIISQLTCQKDFQCIKSGFTVVCHPRDIELELFLGCWQEKPVGCQFSLPFGHTHICRCPLPLYIYKESAKRSLALGGAIMERSPDASNKKEIEEIMGQVQCPKKFICYESGLETLCRARDIGLERFLE